MRKILLFCCITLLIHGCGPAPTRPDPQRIEARETAESALAAGNYHTAASGFEELADQARGLEARQLRLSAAEAWFKADDMNRSQSQLEVLDFDADEQPLLFLRQQLLAAHLEVAAAQSDAALGRLADIYPPDDRPDLKVEYHLLRAQAFSLHGDDFASVAERLAADREFRDDAARLDHADKLWQALRQLERAELNRLRDAVSGDDAQGWVELALIERARLTDTAILQRTLDDWQLSYPRHPGSQLVIEELREFTAVLDTPPQQIALLLPFTGSHAESATTIRDGLLAAWYQDSSDKRPEVHIYDANESNISAVYAEAIDNGADWVIGPLDKAAVAALVETVELRVPTLTLNHYDGDEERIRDINRGQRVPGLYQFALAPEDEARQIADRAWFDGHVRALILTPANDWGRRVQQAFREHYESLGGQVLEQYSYEPAERDLAPPVRALLNIDNSERRGQALRQRLQRSLEIEPRRRQDADLVLMAGPATVGRQVGPQLQYFRAGDLPVYTTSHIFDGRIDATTDADLNGFMFADMPWLFEQSEQISPAQMSVRNHWQQRLDQNPRLFALGVDAYGILPQLNRLALEPGQQFEGVTGRLSVAESGRIQRQALWARFLDGVPLPIDSDQVVGN